MKYKYILHIGPNRNGNDDFGIIIATLACANPVATTCMAYVTCAMHNYLGSSISN